MELIIGGAYQGKRKYAVKRFSLTDDDIYTCSENNGNIDFSKKCIDRLAEYVFWCIKNGEDAVENFKKSDKWKNSIIICDDIFCGVVPLGAEMRAWREMTGRLCSYLSSEATGVTRMFCGLEMKLK